MSLTRGFNRMLARLRDRQVDDASGQRPVFTYFGKTLECVANTFSRRTVLEIGGFQVEADLQLYVRKDQIATTGSAAVGIGDEGESGTGTADTTLWPQSGKLLTFAEREFRIEAVHDPMPWSGDGMLVLACIDPSK